MTDKYGKIHTDGSRSGGQPLNDSIEVKALALLNEVLTKKGFGDDCRYAFIEPENDAHQALCRAIEQHEAFKQEVSDAVVLEYRYVEFTPESLQSFIIPKPKPDPLVEVLDSLEWCNTEALAKDLRAELDAFGLEIREKGQ